MSVDDTPRQRLGQMADAQELDAMAINDALLQLDAFTGVWLLSRAVTTPPASPADGDLYLLGGALTGAWAGHAGAIAYAIDGGWRFYAPFTGLVACIADESRLVIYNGSAWVDAASLMQFQNLAQLGVNTSADATNRLAVKSSALLFDNVGNGVQAKLNKHASTDTVSLLYQDNYSGRAEIGLCGDDNLHIKTSADGSAFSDALIFDGAGRMMLNGQTQLYTVTNNTTTVTPTLQLTGLGADASILFARFGSGNPARFTFGCSKGATRGDFTAVTDSNILGRFSFNGADGTQFREAAWISAFCDQTTTTGNVPGKIAFGTMAPGGTLVTDRMCIFNDGNVFIGTGIATRAVCKLDVDGPVRVKSYAVASLPDASVGAGQQIFVSDEAGGAVIAFSDGTNWRRVTDRAVVS
jgi:hypothetical protein